MKLEARRSFGKLSVTGGASNDEPGMNLAIDPPIPSPWRSQDPGVQSRLFQSSKDTLVKKRNTENPHGSITLIMMYRFVEIGEHG